MMTKTIKADVTAPNNYPFDYIERDLVVQIFTQIEPYITFKEIHLGNGEKTYIAELKIVTNEKGVN